MSGGYWVLWVVWGIFLHTIGPNKFMGVMCVGGEVGKIVFNLGMHFYNENACLVCFNPMAPLG